MNLIALWIVISGLILASLPMLSDRGVFAVPLLKKAKPFWFRLIEFLVVYVIWIGIGRLFEAQHGQVSKQGWEFFVVTFLLFLVAAFPAFTWRYLWKRN